MKVKNILTSTTIAGLTFLSVAFPAFAQITNPVIGDLGNDAEAASSGETVTSYFVTIWNTLISIGALAVIIMFLWGALEWITAGGDSSKIEKARNRIMQSLIGLIILVSSFVILGFISQAFFGEDFSILNLQFTGPGGN